MKQQQRDDILAAIPAMVADRVIGADPAELEAGDTTAAVYAYAHEALCTEGLPEFGSPEWVVLADDDPRKTHAVTLAALAHLVDQAVSASEQVEASHDVAEAMGTLGVKPRPRDTHAALQRRRRSLMEKPAQPAQTAAAIAAQVRFSWASFERQLARTTRTETITARTDKAA